MKRRALMPADLHASLVRSSRLCHTQLSPSGGLLFGLAVTGCPSVR